MSGNRRGFSLVEVMVAGTLLLLLLALISQVIMPVMKASGRTTTRVELQSVGNLTLQKLVNDLNGVSATGLSGPFEDPEGNITFGLHTKTDFSPDGKAIWASQMILYRWDAAEQTLTRTYWPSSADPSAVSPLRVSRLDESELATALTTGMTVILASHVEKFKLITGPGPGFEPPLYVGLRLTREGPSGKTESLALTQSVHLRND